MESVKENRPELWLCFVNSSVTLAVFCSQFACIYTEFHPAFSKVWGYVMVICDGGEARMVYLPSVSCGAAEWVGSASAVPGQVPWAALSVVTQESCSPSVTPL